MGKYSNSYLEFLKYWLPVLLWASLIFYLSSIPGLSSGLPVYYDVFLRKLAHAGIFGVLNLLIFRALKFGHNYNFKKALIWSLILAVLYAFSDEAHQYFVPEREATLFDVGVDSLGAIFSGLLLIFFRKK
jgi:VanZ family protein